MGSNIICSLSFGAEGHDLREDRCHTPRGDHGVTGTSIISFYRIFKRLVTISLRVKFSYIKIKLLCMIIRILGESEA